ncbi:FAD-dependent oxidoreductase [Streptomyces sp. BK340]|uniref:FAD-dependent oxidoreductase n=1 Tax=Streptomyces sp. BK340 TaxID=2572903 RepID=UPI0011A96957|nr:FAD-dependent oxidoreductase [Streptomyces sp. BK340]TVZ90478.1 thioredoxin reductase (NADPH)/alkyl hydroperoxide reductase subunit F [Streptomyces sp. BK340]
MNAPSCDTDVLVVGAGPAGVAAAVMAASLSLRTMVLETGPVGGKLHRIGALGNVPGNWTTGPQLAEALATDLQRLQKAGQCAVEQGRAVKAHGYDDRAELLLDDGRVLTAKTIVVATGVTDLTPSDAEWVTAPSKFSAPPLWRATPLGLTGRTYVLGADRPLGTWLRAHPNVTITLHVLCPPTDRYKAAEVEDDSRVRIVPVSHVTITKPMYGDGWTVDVNGEDGARTVYAATSVLNNLGNKPAALAGLVSDKDGYCPPAQQHGRIRIAGDLRSARYQRIATAQGSGAEAVLAYYYDTTLSGGGRIW